MTSPTTTNLISGINNIDFEDIKSNLIKFLRANNDFPDAIYQGSAFNTLLDVLAYNTHYNMLYSSFTLNEAFLDSCSKYSSAVSIAKSLGYVPYSTTAAKINIDKVSSDYPTVLPPGASFFASYDGKSYMFTTTHAVPLNSYDDTTGQDRYTSAAPFVAYYGKMIEENVAVRSLSKNGVYSNVKALISNKSCDLSTLVVRTVDPVTGAFQVWNPASQYTSIGAHDKVYFTRMREDLYYEIYFGDGVVGATPTNSSSPQDFITINLKYIAVPNATEQPEKITASSVVLSRGADPSNSYITYIDKDVPFVAGSSIESIESIKFHAPRNYTAQNRAVTESDYTTLITQKFPWIESVRVWGGESHTPPRYGTVFISAKPTNRLYTSASEKHQIESYLKNGKTMLSITPLVVDPSYTRVLIDSKVTIDAKKVAADTGSITQKINDAVYTYINNLHLTGGVFRIGEVTGVITDSVYGIVSNDTNIKLQQSIPVVIGVSAIYEQNVENSISTAEGAVTSNKFALHGSDKWNVIKSNNRGELILYVLENNGLPSSSSTIGMVDHAGGIISMNSVIITKTDSPDNNLIWTIQTSSRDISPIKNMILTTDANAIQLTYDVINSKLQNKVN